MSISYNDLEKVNIYCFDLNQNNRRVRKIDCVVVANYEGVVYFSPDIRIEVKDCCVWDGKKWAITDYTEEIKKVGMNHIIETINKGEKHEQEYDY